jgi:S-adenosylmethionine synthetase
MREKNAMSGSKRYLFTSESVTEGHPDKVCDQISDAVLDAILAQDPLARVACEVAVTTGLILVMGEITTKAHVDIAGIARRVVCDIGYTDAAYGMDGETCAVLTSLNQQSPDIAIGVDEALEIRGKQDTDPYEQIGAGDQGLVFGYASNETAELMPLPIALSHRLAERLAQVRKDGTLPYLRPDGKTQVTVEYLDQKPVRIHTIVISSQHNPEVSQEQIKQDLIDQVILPTVPAELVDANTRIMINPTGRFVIGGPVGDSGLTGRKIIVDTYGGVGRHGGGALSGKDPTKVDRSGSYAARHVAKNLVGAGLAERCEVQIAYVIGSARPVSLMVDTFGTGKLSDDALADLVEKIFDLRPAAIIDRFRMRRPIYEPVAAYGHFGRPNLDLPWERLDKVTELVEAAAELHTVANK